MMHNNLMNKRRSSFRRNSASSRRGAAVVECALTAPLLALIFLGSMEVGQYINVSQSVCNASRIGARLAARRATSSVADVETHIEEYLDANGIPEESVSVHVIDEDGNTLEENELAAIPSGEGVSVRVEVEFALIRNIRFLNRLDGASNTSVTTMRRD